MATIEITPEDPRNKEKCIADHLMAMMMMIIIIIYHDFLPTPRTDNHVKSDKTHTQSSRYTS